VAIQSRRQAEVVRPRAADVAGTPRPDMEEAWTTSRVIYFVIASLATIYGVVLGVFWICVLQDAPPSMIRSALSLEGLLFALAPILLIVSAAVLYRAHACTSRRACAAQTTTVALTALVLATKALVVMPREIYTGPQQVPAGIGEMIALAVVVIPSGLFAALLGATAISLGVGLRS
jgi:hypothetical protein